MRDMRSWLDGIGDAKVWGDLDWKQKAERIRLFVGYVRRADLCVRAGIRETDPTEWIQPIDRYLVWAHEPSIYDNVRFRRLRNALRQAAVHHVLWVAEQEAGRRSSDPNSVRLLSAKFDRNRFQ